MNPIIAEMQNSNKFNEYIKNIKENKAPISVLGLAGVGLEQIVGATNTFTKSPICLITYNELQARRVADNLKNYIDNVYFFPKREILSYDYIAESKELPYERIEVLKKIVEKKINVLVVSIESLMQPMISKNVLFKNKIKLEVGKSYDLDKLKATISSLGYTRNELIEAKGEFSIRGGILDISFDEKYGIRIEFWGDEIDSIRKFSIETQRSIEMIDKVEINPIHEYLIENDLETVCKKILDKKYTDKQLENVKEDIELIKSKEYISKIDKYFDCFYNECSSLLDYLDNNYLICVEELKKVNVRAKNVLEDITATEAALIEKERIIPNSLENYIDINKIEEELIKYKIVYLTANDFDEEINTEKYYFKYRMVNYYKSNIEKFFIEIKEAKLNKKRIYIFLDSKEKAKRIKELLDEQEIISEYSEKYSEISNGIQVKISAVLLALLLAHP